MSTPSASEPTVATNVSPYGCQIIADHAAFNGNKIEFFSQGDMTLKCSTFDTIGPRDQHTYQSLSGTCLPGAFCTGGAGCRVSGTARKPST